MTDFISTLCGPCAAGFYEECKNPQPTEDERWIIPCAMLFVGQTESVRSVKGGREATDPRDITDAKSTGRKRAAMLMPFLEGRVCDWAGLKHAGGGVIPIVGCKGTRIADVKSTEDAKERGADEAGHRHHGPDKNTINNAVGVNLHGVCTTCHTRWHALNNEFYDEDGRPSANFPFLPVVAYYSHDPLTAFTDEEWEEAEAWWKIKNKFERGPYPFTPPEGTRKLLPLSAESSTLDDDNPFPESSPFTEIGESV